MPLLILIVSYLIGNFSSSYIIGKITANIDIRDYGSGNAGTTNVMRTLGYKAAAMTLLLDCLKGVISVVLAKKFASNNLGLLAGIVVVVGHNWPILLGLKGGKGIATTIGVVTSISSGMALICIGFGLVILIIFKYVSLAAMLAIILLTILMFFKGWNYFIFSLTLLLLALYQHRGNIQRLIEGKERKVTDRIEAK